MLPNNVFDIQVLLGKLEYHVKVVLFRQSNIKGETNTFYRFITCKVRYLKLFVVVILLIMIYSLLKPQTQKLRKWEYCENLQYCRLKVSYTNQVSNAIHLQKGPEPLNISSLKLSYNWNACTFSGYSNFPSSTCIFLKQSFS